MRSEIMHQNVETIKAEVRSRLSAIEFEMAYQARAAIDRIQFVIRHAEQFPQPCVHVREVGRRSLDALDRLGSLDRRLQIQISNRCWQKRHCVGSEGIMRQVTV
jgi:hypothetical protein